MITLKTLNSTPSTKNLKTKVKVKYIFNGKECFVEEAAIKYYEKFAYTALWSEIDYWGKSMALLFWDIIFAKIKGAILYSVRGDNGLISKEIDPSDKMFSKLFDLSIQVNGMPHDFFKKEFYERRKDLINKRINELKNLEISEQLISSYNKNYGKICRPIGNWNKFSINDLLIAIKGIEKEKYLKILERLIIDFNNNRSGLPDLILYKKNDFFFSEVKSENDNISGNQKNWHDFLSNTLGLRVEILLFNPSDIKLDKIKKMYNLY